MEKPIDIINFTGLTMGDQNDLLEDHMQSYIRPRFLRTIAPVPYEDRNTSPDECIDRTIEKVQEIIEEIEQRFADPNIILLGRSYGAFIALLVAVRMEFQKIAKVISLEGPLHPEVDVQAPGITNFFRACDIHYQNRPRLADEAVRALEALGTSRIVMLQSLEPDGFVANDAQVLPGTFNTLQLPIDSIDQIDDPDSGLILQVPTSMGTPGKPPKGYRLLKILARILPAKCKPHLFWNDEKMQAVLDAIEIVGAPEQVTEQTRSRILV